MLSCILLCVGDAPPLASLTDSDISTLYSVQESTNVMELKTLQGFGIQAAASGVYACIANNTVTTAQQTITITVQGWLKQTIMVEWTW